ncbi:MAG: exonuclease SbcCD subunit D [Corynebacterium sp.]|uniref:metallophosphoesterase family protein n=1 Tax=Corynebacterium sp. TaxID=1720 RepID=UPI0026DB4CDC|nr:exonuclease SbcCD subunit D [Corynebacterium sp.]MDO5098926.1 exonuclease SbcCD subunit D [Corynebacterium sp.]
MTSIRFLHTSDLQIGMTRWFLEDTEDAQARFEAARKTAITRLGEAAQEHECAFIVVAGDVFEHNAISPTTLNRAIEELRQLPVPVYLLPGNHDPLTADSVFYQAATAENIHVFNSTEPIDVAGIELIGVPWHSKKPSKDLVAEATSQLEPSSAIRVVVAHGQTENRGNDIMPELIGIDPLNELIATGAIDYVALGDTHSTMSVGPTGAIWYSGSPEVTDFKELPTGGGESNSGNALIVDITKKGAAKAAVEVVPVQIGRWRFDALFAEVSSHEDIEEFIATLKNYPHKDDTVVKYALRGSVDMTTRAFLEAQLAQLKPLFANLYPRTRTMELTTIPTEDEIADMGFAGFAQAALSELSQCDHPAAEDALALLFHLQRSGDK